MAELETRLHAKLNGVTEEIKLYTTVEEVGDSYITLNVNGTECYAKLGPSTDKYASVVNARVPGASEALKVLKQITIPYTELEFTTPGTYKFTVPTGVTALKVALCGGAGGASSSAGYGYYKAGDGGESSVGDLIKATGGIGGQSYDEDDTSVGGSCFIAGTKVLGLITICGIQTLSWLNIEDVQPNDYLIGANGQINQVLCPYVIPLGDDRAMLKTDEENPLVFAADHRMWIRQDGKEYWGVFDYNYMLNNHKTKLLNGLTPSQDAQRRMFEKYGIKPHISNGCTKELPFAVYGNYEFGTIDGWKKIKVKQAREYDGKTLVYSFVMGGNHTYFANGYLCSGFADDTDFDYSTVEITKAAETMGKIFRSGR